MNIRQQAAHLLTPGGALVHFINKRQRAVILSLMAGEEGDWFAQKMLDLATAIETMPVTGANAEVRMKDQVVHLHYFIGSIDSWITELDVSAPEDEGEHHQAYGAQRLNRAWDAEFGYISIPELLDAGAELDLHWTPKKWSEVKL